MEILEARKNYFILQVQAKKEEFRKKEKEFDLGLESAEELLETAGEVSAAETELNLVEYNIISKSYELIRELDCYRPGWIKGNI
jgi:outer membrane protein TolC